MDVGGGVGGEGDFWKSQAWAGRQRDWWFISELCRMMMRIKDLISGGSMCQFKPADQLLWFICRLFGDDSDLHFWTVASHYLQSFAYARQLSMATADGQVQSEGIQPLAHNHLDICHDVLCESSYFQVSFHFAWTWKMVLFKMLKGDSFAIISALLQYILSLTTVPYSSVISQCLIVRTFLSLTSLLSFHPCCYSSNKIFSLWLQPVAICAELKELSSLCLHQ